MKDTFFNQLQDAITQIPDAEEVIILGDFNARVGAGSIRSDVSHAVRGPHGIGQIYDAGLELLCFLARNELSICNTWFAKKRIHVQSWQHPCSQVWHCIGYVIV